MYKPMLAVYLTMHRLFMKRCLQLAGQGKGMVAPNPMVGALLVHNGRIIGQGRHEQYGGAHAEVNCFLSVAGADRHLIADSTMYVSLEPCAHYGKTPPCAWRIIKEGVKKVVACNTDPFAEVQGRGIDMLRQQGIAVTTGILEEEGAWLNRRFFCFHTQKRPYIILKWAQTEQGFFAPLNRSRFQMSNEHSKQLLHKWRTEEAAIMVGHATAVSDDPMLTSRLWPGRQPLRLVLDKKRVLPKTQRLFHADAPTWIINESLDKSEAHLTYVKLPFDEILLTRILEKLHADGRQSLIVEGGAVLLQSFIDAGLWDEARVFHTEAMLAEGLPAPTLKHAQRIWDLPVAGDLLRVYTHSASPYKYVSGMEL